MRSTATVALLACLALPSLVLGDHNTDSRLSRRHNGLSKRRLDERGGGDARYTFYDITTGEVACGGFYSPGDFVVALNSAQFGGGQDCGKEITISYNGKTTQAKVVDECPGCPYLGLDLTQGLFSYFASTDAGVIYGSWEFGSGAPPPPPPPPPPPSPKPTTTHHQEPTTTWQPPTTTYEAPKPTTTSEKPKPTTTSTSTSTWTPPSTTSSKPTPTTTSTTSKSTATSATTHGYLPVSLGVASVVPQSTPLSGTQNLLQISDTIISLGALILSA